MTNAIDASSIVAFCSVHYKIDGVAILGDLNLRVNAGEVLVLLGESGCGKTTTLKLVNRLIEPTAGCVLVEGKATTAWDAIKLRRHIGYVIQDGGLFPHFTVAENVALVLRLENWEAAKKRDRTHEMLDLVGLDPGKFADRFPQELSGGQRQRVAIARATIMQPPLILADEPTGNLDSASGNQVIEILEHLHTAEGATLIIVTHDPALGRRARRRIGIADGKIARDETN